MIKTIIKESLWVVIPTYNRADDLISCLDSLSNAGLVMEHIVVIDNASQDDTSMKIKRNYPEVNIILLENNIGASAGSNIGFEYALNKSALYILRMDSDTIVDQNFIVPLLDIAQSDPKIGIVGPKIYFYDPPDVIWYAGAFSKNSLDLGSTGHRHEKDSPENNQLEEVDYVWGASMLIKSDVLKRTGGFDTDFYIYFEEHDLCDRVRGMGYKLMYVPDSHVWHKVGSVSNNAWTAYQWNRSKMILFRKHARSGFHKLYLYIYAYVYAISDFILNSLHIRQKNGNRGPLKKALSGLWAGMNLKLSNKN